MTAVLAAVAALVIAWFLFSLFPIGWMVLLPAAVAQDLLVSLIVVSGG